MKHPVNFRDLGGIPTTDGRQVKQNLLLRSGRLSGLSPAETRRLLEDYHLTTILDLRSQPEREEFPNDPLPVQTVVIDIFGENPGRSASKDFLESLRTVAQVDKGMEMLYADLIQNPMALAGYRKFLDAVLGTTEGAVLFHCFAGKDRTGIGAAILLTLLGVGQEEIFRDYLRTNMQRRGENQRMVAQLRAQGTEEEQLEALRAAMKVKSRYLRRAFAVAEEKYGGFTQYCTRGLGVTKEEVDLLRSRYLIPREG